MEPAAKPTIDLKITSSTLIAMPLKLTLIISFVLFIPHTSDINNMQKLCRL